MHRFGELIEDVHDLPMGGAGKREGKETFLHALTTCHQLKVVDGEVIGDPLDVKMFMFTKWTIEEGHVAGTGVIKGRRSGGGVGGTGQDAGASGSGGSEHHNEPNRISIKFESHRLREQHRPNQRALRRVEPRSHDHPQRRPLIHIIYRANALSDTDHFCAGVEKGLVHIADDVPGGAPEGEVVIADGNFRNGDGFAGEHGFVDDCVAGKEEEVGGEDGERRFEEIDDIARNEVGGVVNHPW